MVLFWGFSGLLFLKWQDISAQIVHVAQVRVSAHIPFFRPLCYSCSSQLGQSLPLKNLANIPFTSINVSKHLIKGCIYTQRVFIGRGSFQQWLSFKASAIWRRLAERTVAAVIYNALCRLPFNPVAVAEIWKIVPIQERLFKLQWDRLKTARCLQPPAKIFLNFLSYILKLYARSNVRFVTSQRMGFQNHIVSHIPSTHFSSWI